VGKGKILQVKGIRGFYRLNESLSRMGMREVPSLPKEISTRTIEEILKLAFTMIDPEAFPAPSWLLTVEAMDLKDADHARLLADQHREPVDALASVAEKHAYFGGVLDAQAMMEAEMKSDEE